MSSLGDECAKLMTTMKITSEVKSFIKCSFNNWVHLEMNVQSLWQQWRLHQKWRIFIKYPFNNWVHLEMNVQSLWQQWRLHQKWWILRSIHLTVELTWRWMCKAYDNNEDYIRNEEFSLSIHLIVELTWRWICKFYDSTENYIRNEEF